MNEERRVVIKIDCDTFEGTKTGVPALLKIFEKFHIQASFFFTLGPDRSGLAVRRIFTQKGFFKKMLRSKAVSLYGPKTMLYGTLLPAPHIGRGLKNVIRLVGDHGHEVGVHGWDHVKWHDRLDRMPADEIRSDYSKAHEMFSKIFGTQARTSAAPGWHITPTYLDIQESFQLSHTSNTRLGSPFFPVVGPRVYTALEIPTTLPTWDEALANPESPGGDNIIQTYRDSVKGTEVHTIHTEVEGGAHNQLFERQLEAWTSDGVTFLTLEQYANECRNQKSEIPRRIPTRIQIPFRGGLVSSSARLQNSEAVPVS